VFISEQIFLCLSTPLFNLELVEEFVRVWGNGFSTYAGHEFGCRLDIGYMEEGQIFIFHM
jgi:hypothetical protein